MTSSPFRRIDQQLFARVAAEARQHPRLCLNHNLHQEQDQVQRFLHGLQPGSDVRPHRHRRNGSGRGLEVAEDQFHTLVALDAESVIFELKKGPY